MSEQTKGIMSAVIIVACLALLGFLVHEKVDGAAVAAVSTVTVLIAYFQRQPPKNDAGAGIVVFAALATIFLPGLGCKAAQSAADAACETLIANGDTPLEESICATLDDFIALGNLVLGTRSAAAKMAGADAGTMTHRTCQMIPHTDVCATDDELATAIKARKAGEK